MNCNPELAALFSQPWSNNACRGYVIYAMEHCGFAPGDIRRVVAELHEVFDFCGLEEAQQRVLCISAASGTGHPTATIRRAGLAACPSRPPTLLCGDAAPRIAVL